MKSLSKISQFGEYSSITFRIILWNWFICAFLANDLSTWEIYTEFLFVTMSTTLSAQSWFAKTTVPSTVIMFCTVLTSLIFVVHLSVSVRSSVVVLISFTTPMVHLDMQTISICPWVSPCPSSDFLPIWRSLFKIGGIIVGITVDISNIRLTL